MNLVIDTCALVEKLGLEQAMKTAKKAGFAGVDYMFPNAGNDCLFDENPKQYARNLKTAIDANGLFCNQTHASYAMKCGEAFDMSTANYRAVVNALECAALIGAKCTVVHAITVAQNKAQEINFEEYNLAFYRSLIPYCEKFGIKVAIENLYIRDTNCGCYRAKIGGTPESLCGFIRKLNSPYFTACVDLGHVALVGNDVAAYLRGMDKDLFGAIHIHDNTYLADSHTLPYQGKFDWDSIMDALKTVGYSGDFTFEIITFLRQFPAEVLPQAVSFSFEMAKYLVSKMDK